MKIAILHEMLIKRWGAEKVVESLIGIFPEADIYTLIYDEKKMGEVFPRKKIHPQCFNLNSQKIYTLTKKQRLCLPFMKKSVESLDFSEYDRVIVSSSGFAHGLITIQKTKTIIYYHAPARYMWDWAHEYRKEIWFNVWVRWFLFGRFLLWLRQWDYEAAQKNDILLANSTTTQKRIQKYYRRDSQVLYPPIETKRFQKKLSSHNFQDFFKKDDYYIILSALTEFKKLDIAIENIKKVKNVNLLIIWEWEYRKSLEQLTGASGNILFSGAQYGDDLVSLIQSSLWLIFPWEEDFGIVPIEIMAAGKPVFALAKWWLTETIISWKTGHFFYNSDGSDFIQEFKKFHNNNTSNLYSSMDCIRQANKYSEKIFEECIKKMVKNIGE